MKWMNSLIRTGVAEQIKTGIRGFAYWFLLNYTATQACTDFPWWFGRWETTGVVAESCGGVLAATLALYLGELQYQSQHEYTHEHLAYDSHGSMVLFANTEE